MKEGVAKVDFIKELENVLKLTREGVSHLTLEDQDTVAIYYNNGFKRIVDITMDSGMAIIRDVARSI